MTNDEFRSNKSRDCIYEKLLIIMHTYIKERLFSVQVFILRNSTERGNQKKWGDIKKKQDP